MDKKQIKKNILDMKYQFESQKINALLIICSVGILAFIGTFIWYKERLFFGATLSLIIIIVSVFLYMNVRKKMKSLLEEISEL